MITLNSVAIDLIPYCIRTIFHSRDLPLLVFISSTVALNFLLLDFCEIWYKGGRTVISEVNEESLKKLYGVQGEDIQT
jgi:hypothetical protein